MMGNQSSYEVCKLLIVIPHFFKETRGGTGYGSGQEGARLKRSIALARCLHSLRLQRRSHSLALLNIKDKIIQCYTKEIRTGTKIIDIEVDIHVFCNRDNMISEVLDDYKNWVTVHNVDLENPKLLPIAARNWLINTEEEYKLYAYMEDDIVINDPFFFDKQLWFLEKTDHKAVLMPHRFEQNIEGEVAQFLVDGPLNSSFIEQFYMPMENFAHGKWDPNEKELWFDRHANPHSGCFTISHTQKNFLKQKPLRDNGFVTPLETAATLTVMEHFPVLKPSIRNHDFLLVEHAHPTFSGLLDQWQKYYE